MGTILAFLAAVISIATIVLDFFPPKPTSALCLSGICRFDQIYRGLDSPAEPAESVDALILTDPANPLAWCAYAEILSLRGETGKAAAAFDRATRLGPGVAAVWMRAANFDFVHDRRQQSFKDSAHILAQTPGFDQIVFSYLTKSGASTASLLGNAIPEDARSAAAWLEWLRVHGSDRDLIETWSWMREKNLTDEKSAVSVAKTLWERKAYAAAQKVWAEWLGKARGNYLQTEWLTNRNFANMPSGSPFDWTLDPSSDVVFAFEDGLAVRLLGRENLDFGHLRQMTVVPAGRYRFAAEMAAQAVTTDEGFYWTISAISGSKQTTIETTSLKGTTLRAWMSAEFVVGEGTEALEIRLRRRPSRKFDNKISGTLHVYQVTLVPAVAGR